jgi:hypothetical protein
MIEIMAQMVRLLYIRERMFASSWTIESPVLDLWLTCASTGNSMPGWDYEYEMYTHYD